MYEKMSGKKESASEAHRAALGRRKACCKHSSAVGRLAMSRARQAVVNDLRSSGGETHTERERERKRERERERQRETERDRERT